MPYTTINQHHRHHHDDDDDDDDDNPADGEYGTHGSYNGNGIDPLRPEFQAIYANVSKDETIPLLNTRRSARRVVVSNGYGLNGGGGSLRHHNGVRDSAVTTASIATTATGTTSLQEALKQHEEEKRRRCKSRIDTFLTSTAIVASVLALFLCAAVLLVGSFLFTNQETTTKDPKPIFDEYDRYILEDYDAKPTFSDFLPGIAGIYGKPVWAFYVNRGQCMASFGVRSRDYPILEFNAANKAYQNTPSLGFRTFVQGSRSSGSGRGNTFLTEPFSPQTTCHDDSSSVEHGGGIAGEMSLRKLPKRTMYIGQSEVEIQEIDYEYNIETNVTYFVLPDENYPALVRRTSIRNLGRSKLEISLLDGLARTEPMGGKINNLLKNEGFSTQASMGVYRPYNNSLSYPFYRLLRGPEYFATEPGAQSAGHFCLAVLEADNPHLVPIVYDTSKVFGGDTSLLNPIMLRKKSIKDIVEEPQYGFATTSSAFAAVHSKTLREGESLTLSSFYGESAFMLQVPVIMRRITMYGFVQFKQARSREVIKQITSPVATVSGNHTFDIHARQMLLDNSLRGGTPMIVGDVDDAVKLKNFDEDPRLKVYHLFSRFDGDLERDYNKFEVDPLFYSQGSGKFQEVIQNRKNDVILHPRTGSFAIQTFLSFIQSDGYEPLIVDGVVFELKDWDLCNQIAYDSVGPADGHRAQRDGLRGVLNAGPFRFGEVFKFMNENNVQLIISRTTFVDKVAAVASIHPVANFDEGYWPDHWVYYMELIDAYLAVYPDGEEALMFDQALPYFFSPAIVQPRRKKFVMFPPSYGTGKGYRVEQVNATIISPEKEAWILGRQEIESQWQQMSNHTVFQSSPIAKLFLLSTLKFATRDPLAMGIEYETGKAGWNNAMEGLSRSLGSGLAETYELERLLKYVLSVVERYQRPVTVPKELTTLVDTIELSLKDLSLFESTSPVNWTNVDDFRVPSGYLDYWNNLTEAREAYRESIMMSFSGSTVDYYPSFLIPTLKSWIEQVKAGQERSMIFGFQEEEGSNPSNSPLPPSFFTYEITDWYELDTKTVDGMPFVHVQELRLHRYPLFLKGVIGKMKGLNSTSQVQRVYNAVQQSPLRDTKLGMIKSSASLQGQREDLGKIMTYTPGWFDNESIWLELSYKLYAQLLHHGLYDEFYTELKSGVMVPFMDPDQYGRPIMESSAFIVSSAFQDPSAHGRGVIARLNGAAEFLDMWVLMMIGPKPFFVDRQGKLRMQLMPALPLWLFQERPSLGVNASGSELVISFNLFGQTNVTYYNLRRKDLFRIPPSRYVIGMRDGSIHRVQGSSVPSVLADKIRRVVFMNYIDVFFE